ncbi:MAG TPA: hypothetical protein PKX12_17285 [Spirochaetota bacterium]|nr:hypothetical protein [Spirochaetota bacterium]
MIKQGSRTLKDFGWQSANAANASQMSKNLTLTWYHSAAWNITLAPNINPGRYSAIVSHQDLNSGKTLNANYSFSVKAASGGAAAQGGYSVDDFIASVQRKDFNRLHGYFYSGTQYEPKHGITNFQGFRKFIHDIHDSGEKIIPRKKKPNTVWFSTLYEFQFIMVGGSPKVSKIRTISCEETPGGCGGV